MSATHTTTGLSELVDRFIAHIRDARNLAENSVRSYGYDLRDFVQYLRNRGLDNFAEIDETFVEDYLAHTRRRGLSAPTANRRLHAIRGLAKFLTRRRFVLRNFAADVQGLETGRPLPVVLDRDQVTRLLAAPNAAQDPMYLRDRAILELLYGSGLRAAEATRIQAGEIHADTQSVRIHGKGRKQRIVPVTRTAVMFAVDYTKYLRPTLGPTPHRAPNLFLSRRGRRLGDKNVWRIVKKYSRRIGLNDQVGPHTLRHCFATHMLNAGANLAVVQRLLGHEAIATTGHYLHVATDEIEAAFRVCNLRDGATGCGSRGGITDRGDGLTTRQSVQN